MTELRGPIDWANQQQTEREQRATEHCGRSDPSPLHNSHEFMRGGTVYRCPGGAAEPQQPVRYTADTITDNALDQLYAERDVNVRRALAYGQAWLADKQRAEQAEAAVERAEREQRGDREAISYWTHQARLARDFAAYNDRARAATIVQARRQAARADQAEAAIARVRKVAAWLSRNYPSLDHDHRILAALAEPKEPRP